MSGLAGVWNLDGRPAEPAVVSTLASSLAHRGPDATGRWVSGPIALACNLLRVTPESETEIQPATDRAGNVLVFDGRLDNRAELLKSTAGGEVTADSPDSALVLAAWQKWSDASLARLEGDFALAFFDARTRTLHLARDPVGSRPLYHWTDGKTFVLASEIKGILSHPDVPRRPNQELLADFLLLERLPYDDDSETFFRDVHAVRPGHCVRIRPGRIRSEPFWDFDPRAQLRYGTYSDYAERLRELLIEAVKRRVRSTRPIAVSASGGLDSSIVLCIADDLRRSGGVKAPLVALSYGVDERADESAFLELLGSARGLHIERTDRSPIDDDAGAFARQAWHSEWPRLDDAWRAQRPMLAAARARGARVLLTGHWSDQLFFVTGYLSDLVVRLAWRQVAAHLREYAAWFPDADPGYFRSRFRRELWVHLTPRTIRAPLRPWLRAWTRAKAPSHVPAELARLIRRSRPARARPRSATAHAREIYGVVRAQAHRLQFEADEKLTAGCGIEASTPFLDRDVIAFLMSIPGEMQTHNGVPRALLRDAMRGIVPDAILRRRWRGEPAPATPASDAPSPEFLALEFWSRAFFSDTLTRLSPPSEGDCESMKTPDPPRESGDGKLPYSAPKLTVHGDLRTLTTAKGSDRTEAGQPKTFSSGMP